jgi:hypothetical protein
MFKLLFLPLKVTKGGVKLLGVRNTLLIAVGVGIGLLVAPQTGAQARAKLKARLAAAGGGPADGVPGDEDLTL